MAYYRRIRDLREDNDLSEVPFELAIRLAKLYNVSLDYIADLIPDPRPLEQNPKKNQ